MIFLDENILKSVIEYLEAQCHFVHDVRATDSIIFEMAQKGKQCLSQLTVIFSHYFISI